MTDSPESPSSTPKPPVSAASTTASAASAAAPAPPLAPTVRPAPRDERFTEPLDADTRRYLLRNLVYLAVVIVVLVVLAALAQRLLGAEVAAAAHYLTHRGGYPGVALSIWLIDTFTVPMSPDVVLAFVAHSGSSLNHALGLLVICVASVIAGNTGFYLARWLGGRAWIRRRIERTFDKGHALFARFGVWAVVIAGLTPVPFSIVCWLAGVYHMRPGKLFLATLSRIPRFVGFYYLFRIGFSL